MQKKSLNTINYPFYNLFKLLAILFISSCAQISAPTGGKRDTSHPYVTKSTPQNPAVNFKQKEIIITFNEWLQPLQNAKNQVIISPPMEPFPKIEVARNVLSIKRKDTLQANTTYSIFFGDNIKDNNEGNPYPNFKYIFSTGNFIDSIKIKGQIKTMPDKIPDNTYVLLYKDTEDSAFTKKHPYYITKVNNEGLFSLENVKQGIYKIYALSDKNGNYYYDLPTEAIGFTDSLFSINSNLDTLSFSLFLPEDEKLRIFDFDRVIKGGILHLTFNRELSFTKDEINVSIKENNEITPIAFQTEDAKKMAVYFPKMPTDTGSFTLSIKNKEQLVDSLSVRMESKKSTNPIMFFTDTTAYKSLNVIETQPLKLVSSHYSLSMIDKNNIIITDTSGAKIPISVSRDEDMHTYLFSATWRPGIKYKLIIGDSTISDLVGNVNKKQEFQFSTLPIKKTGNLLVYLELPQKHASYIVFLKDNSGKVIDKRVIRDSQAVKIDYGLQLPGIYNVEVIDDVNDNGIWNSGNFKNRTLPEKFFKELKPIIVKENWDAEEKIKVDFNPISQHNTTNPAINKSILDAQDKEKLLKGGFNREK